MRVAHVVFPRTDPLRPVLGFVWDAITALRDRCGIDVEVIVPLPVRAVRAAQSFARRMRSAGRWPEDIEETLLALSPRPQIVPYVPLPNRAIEAAATAIAMHLLARAPAARPQILHGSFLDDGGYAAALAAQAIGARSIAVAHGSDVRAARGALDAGRQRRARYTIANADRLLAVSHHLAAELALAGGRADVVRYSTYAARHPLAATPAPKNALLFAGRISAEKGVLVLLEALALLPSDVHLTLVGPSAPGFDVLAEARNLDTAGARDTNTAGARDTNTAGARDTNTAGTRDTNTAGTHKTKIAGRVRVEPERPQSELQALYANATCTVLPSLHEGFGIVLVESLLVGRPVVGANVGGIREIITQENGALADPGDARALAAAITTVLTRSYDPHRLRESAMPMTWDRAAQALARATQAVIEG